MAVKQHIPIYNSLGILPCNPMSSICYLGPEICIVHFLTFKKLQCKKSTASPSSKVLYACFHLLYEQQLGQSTIFLFLNVANILRRLFTLFIYLFMVITCSYLVQLNLPLQRGVLFEHTSSLTLRARRGVQVALAEHCFACLHDDPHTVMTWNVCSANSFWLSYASYRNFNSNFTLKAKMQSSLAAVCVVSSTDSFPTGITCTVGSVISFPAPAHYIQTAETCAALGISDHLVPVRAFKCSSQVTWHLVVFKVFLVNAIRQSDKQFST